MDSLNAVALRGICSLYFENHVSPLVRSLQEVQDRFREQLQDTRVEQSELRGQLSDMRTHLDSTKKMHREDTPRKAAEQVKTGAVGGGGVVEMVRLKELASSMRLKADASDVVSMAQMNKAVVALDQKLASQIAELSKVLKSKADALLPEQGAVEAASADLPEGVLAQVRDLAARLELKADAADVPTHSQARALCADLLAMGGPGGEGKRPSAASCVSEASSPGRAPLADAKTPDMKRVQLVIAAAAAQFDRQLRELKRQMKELRQDALGGSIKEEGGLPNEVQDNRWPGRKLDLGMHRRTKSDDLVSESDAVSEAPSLDTGSVASAGLCGEDREELKKIRTIVAAAGTAFSRDLRGVRGHLRDLQAEVQGLKDHVGLSAATAGKQ